MIGKGICPMIFVSGAHFLQRSVSVLDILGILWPSFVGNFVGNFVGREIGLLLRIGCEE